MLGDTLLSSGCSNGPQIAYTWQKREKAIEKERKNAAGSESDRIKRMFYMIKLLHSSFLISKSILKQNAESISTNQHGFS